MRRTAVLITVLLLATHAWGLNLEPLTREFAPSGRGSIQTFRVTNTQSDNIAVRISMTTRRIAENGEETRTDAGDEFVVFPSRVFLSPGQSQAVRVQYRGPAAVERERSYRIIAEQVPVREGGEEAADGGGIALNIIYRYVGSVYVTPPNPQSDIVLTDVTPVRGRENAVALRFENRGTGHAIVQNARVTLGSTAGGPSATTHELTSDDLDVIGAANFTAGTALVEVVDLPSGMRPDGIDVDFEFDTVR